MKRLVIAAFVLAIASCAPNEGGTGAIRGVVRDLQTGLPVPAMVEIVGSDVRTAAAIDGSFFFPQVKAGYATLSFDRKPYPKRVHVGAGTVARVRIFLPLKKPPRGRGGVGRSWGDHRMYRVVGSETRVHRSRIDCAIIPVKEPFHIGDHPAFRVVLRNNTGRNLYMVAPVEGSDEGDRYPIVTMTITGPENGLDIPRPGVRCGNLSPLGPGNFKLLAPGETLEPIDSPWWRYKEFDRLTFARAGEFTVTFRYSSDEENIGRWMGQDQEAYELLKHVPRLDIEKSITVNVVE